MTPDPIHQRLIADLQSENKNLRRQRDYAREQAREMRVKWEDARSQKTVAVKDARRAARVEALAEVMDLLDAYQALPDLRDAVDQLGKEASL
jgi:phage shock protein A